MPCVVLRMHTKALAGDVLKDCALRIKKGKPVRILKLKDGHSLLQGHRV